MGRRGRWQTLPWQQIIKTKKQQIVKQSFERRPCDRPRVIESLQGKNILDISCGGAHSAAITASGELYTWGKGRYGRLGHRDSEDQLKPKLVEALIGNSPSKSFKHGMLYLAILMVSFRIFFKLHWYRFPIIIFLLVQFTLNMTAILGATVNWLLNL